jgi:hypothetical protein
MDVYNKTLGQPSLYQLKFAKTITNHPKTQLNAEFGRTSGLFIDIS